MASNIALPTEFTERVTESLRAQIGQLIPQESLDKMVADEVKAFFFECDTPFTVIAGGYNSRDKIVARITPFRALVWDLCRSTFEKQIKATLESEELSAKITATYNGHENHIKAELTKTQTAMLSAALPDMLVNLLKVSFATTLQEANLNIVASMNSHTFPPTALVSPSDPTVQNHRS